MAEFVFRHMVKEKKLLNKFHIASSATSREEIGNDVHSGTRKKLKEVGVLCDCREAIQLTKRDYEEYDYILCMENYNIKNAQRIVGEDKAGKIRRLLDFSSSPRDIADPWYTGNFHETYEDIVEGCEALLEHILEKGIIE